MWIFWHDWWPVYLAGWCAFSVITAVFLAALKRRDQPKPCVPISCPPVEKIEVTWTVLRCSQCGSTPTCEPSMWEIHDRYEWSCPIHGLIYVAARDADGRVELEEVTE